MNNRLSVVRHCVVVMGCVVAILMMTLLLQLPVVRGALGDVLPVSQLLIAQSISGNGTVPGIYMASGSQLTTAGAATFNGAVTVNGTATINGTSQFNATATFQNLTVSGTCTGCGSSTGNVTYLTYGGTDWGAQINAADTALGTKAGTIVACGTGNITTQVVLSSYHTLRFCSGTYSSQVVTGTSGTILMHDNTTVEGDGWNTVLVEPPGADSSHLNYFVIEPWLASVQGGNSTGVTNNLAVRNLQLLGAGKPTNGAQATLTVSNTHNMSIDHVWFNATSAIGIQLGNSDGTHFCSDVIITNNRFTNVGGGVPPGFAGGGGVTIGWVDCRNVIIANNNFVDPYGAADIDVEPNVTGDYTQGTIVGNVFDHSGISSSVIGMLSIGLIIQDGAGCCNNLHNPIKVSANYFIGGASGGQMQTAIQLIGQGRITITDNSIHGTTSPCLTVSTSQLISVTGNKCDTFMGNGSAISISGTVYSDFTGNMLNEPTSVGCPACGALIESGASDYNTFQNNKGNQFPTIIGAHSVAINNILIPTFP